MFKWSSHFHSRMAAKHDCPGFVQCFFIGFQLGFLTFPLSTRACMVLLIILSNGKVKKIASCHLQMLFSAGFLRFFIVVSVRYSVN